MRIFRETLKGVGVGEFKATLLYENATQEDWDKLILRSMRNAKSYGAFELPCFYPESRFSFGVELRSGKKYRFRRTL